MNNSNINLPLISVVVPVYRVEKEIKQCLNSIIAQTYENLQIILVDDGSPDLCGEICEEYAVIDRRITVIHKDNGGLSDARNCGIDIANGKYITFIDSDDYIEPDFVERLYNSIAINNCDIAICSHMDVYPNCVKLYSFSKNNQYENVMEISEAIEHMLYKNGYDVSAWGKLYRKELFDDIRYPKGRLFEDAATTYKLFMLSRKIVFVNYVGYKYVMRENSIVNVGFNEKKFDLITSTNEMCDEIDNIFPKLKNATIRRRVYANFSTLRLMGDVYLNYEKEIKEMTQTINSYRKIILFDKKSPLRDKIAIFTLFFGEKVFFNCWEFYKKITNRL